MKTSKTVPEEAWWTPQRRWRGQHWRAGCTGGAVVVGGGTWVMVVGWGNG